jgi:hypothetical protein
MTSQEPHAVSAPVQTTAVQSEQPVPKQPWQRPTVTFVPMQVTAGAKSGLDDDGGSPTPV